MAGIENLHRIIEQISRDKGIDRALLIDTVEEAVRLAVKRRYGSQRDIEVQYNEDLGEVEVFQYRTVVEEVRDPAREITLEEARLRDPEAGLDDDIGEKLADIGELGRIAAQSAKQVIIQRMREAERDVIYDLYRDREGAVVNGIVQRFEKGDMIVNLGRTDALLPRENQIPKRSYKQGDRIRAYLERVRRPGQEEGEPVKARHKDAQLVLNRVCNEFLIKLFELEVPEIAEGIVKIMGVSRDPGFRAKIAVSSLESDVDPVGACVGMKGARVQNVVQELQGERIDIVVWSPDPAKYASNALAPAEVELVEVDEERQSLLVVVPDDQLSLAIGKQGQNVRLAHKLLGWRIDVKSRARYDNLNDPGYRGLLLVLGGDENVADRFFYADVKSAADFAECPLERIAELARVDMDMAMNFKEHAAEVRMMPQARPTRGHEPEETPEAADADAAAEETAAAAAPEPGDAAGAADAGNEG